MASKVLLFSLSTKLLSKLYVLTEFDTDNRRHIVLHRFVALNRSQLCLLKLTVVPLISLAKYDRID